MGLIRLLVALHPNDWRQRYGEEFTALLEDSALSPSVAVDVAAHAARLQIGAHINRTLVLMALVVSEGCHLIAREAGFAHNVLWAPTNPIEALTLLGTVGPWIALMMWAGARRWIAAGA